MAVSHNRPLCPAVLLPGAGQAARRKSVNMTKKTKVQAPAGNKKAHRPAEAHKHEAHKPDKKAAAARSATARHAAEKPAARKAAPAAPAARAKGATHVAAKPAAHAPTAAHSVIYDENGVFAGLEFCATNPLMVLVDLDIVAAAPPRYIVAGMGDAFSTFYEARCCMENPEARTARGARPTMAALAIARQCRDLLFSYGTAALEEIRERRAGDALDHIVEANILLSGLGFESGGLAGAHGVAQGLTACSDLHRNCLHGELVAIGVMTQLIMERRMDEAEQAARFFKEVGLPLHLARLGFDPLKRGSELDTIVEHSLDVFFIRYEPFEITKSLLKNAMLEADEFGRTMERSLTR